MLEKNSELSLTENLLSANEIKQTIEVIEKLMKNHNLMAQLSQDQRVALLKATGQLSRPHKLEQRQREKTISKTNRKNITNQENKIRANTGIRQARQKSVFQAPLQISELQISSNTLEAPPLQSPRNCYICKAEFTQLHFFYDSMCRSCGDFNYRKRFQTTSLKGQIALITGSRLKIGYHATLMMLRAGAHVIATTRFPIDSALRFSKESDFKEWQDRLNIYGLDLRHTPSVEIFSRAICQNYPRLDLLINNAAQTVRRPPGFYSHLMTTESSRWGDLPEAVRKLLEPFEDCKTQLNSFCKSLPNTTDSSTLVTWHEQGPGIGIRASAQLSQIPYTYDNSLKGNEVFPQGQLDPDLQQIDLRSTNSWRYRLAEVPIPEMLEVQLVNAIAPFVLCNQLLPLMKRDFTGQKHIVNVTAMEGKFHRFKKSDRHPHTNMAKAALNMLTHTSASDLAKDGIYMNAVDTGWVTDEDPIALAALKQEVHDFQPPLDIVDGAARICDPFFDGILTQKHWCGKFLKDYKPIDW